MNPAETTSRIPTPEEWTDAWIANWNKPPLAKDTELALRSLRTIYTATGFPPPDTRNIVFTHSIRGARKAYARLHAKTDAHTDEKCGLAVRRRFSEAESRAFQGLPSEKCREKIDIYRAIQKRVRETDGIMHGVGFFYRLFFSKWNGNGLRNRMRYAYRGGSVRISASPISRSYLIEVMSFPTNPEADAFLAVNRLCTFLLLRNNFCIVCDSVE